MNNEEREAYLYGEGEAVQADNDNKLAQQSDPAHTWAKSMEGCNLDDYQLAFLSYVKGRSEKDAEIQQLKWEKQKLQDDYAQAVTHILELESTGASQQQIADAIDYMFILTGVVVNKKEVVQAWDDAKQLILDEYSRFNGGAAPQEGKQ